MTAASASTQQRQFPCKQCGAGLEYAPGTREVTCKYCGAVNEILVDPAAQVVENDFRSALVKLAAAEPTREVLSVKCNVCGAESQLPPDETADKCPFCGSAIVATAGSTKAIKPGCLLPFYIKKEQAVGSFRQWLAGRWFAPNGLAQRADNEAIRGIYLPAWTYDCQTNSSYTGERGDDYWDTETYTEMENGRPVTRTRQVRKTRWWPVSGDVDNSFDDILVVATQALQEKYVDALEPWDLKDVIPYSDEYLSGFVAQSYQIDLVHGFEEARQIMDGTIRQSICQDIGGDHQRIFSVSTRYDGITYKHLLLPVWVSAYRYQEKTYHFLVNARTGEVQGERPYSAIKIALAVIFAVVIVLILVALFVGQR